MSQNANTKAAQNANAQATMAGYENARLEQLAALIDSADSGPSWIRLLAAQSVKVAIAHRQLVDASTTKEAHAAVERLSETVREATREALRLGEYHLKLSQLVGQVVRR